ncbi:MAG: winged helix-turn-helix domain-containing protein [Arenimonas sp.]|uniref:helix-turn-helix transcriptional regulator n=1 Tax=Arenimonas sp. TaxID=1872635 RepID=UPI0025C57DAC|nr:winged helix-turn-helix domain-containing protein [Arenimonas sp.]MBW8368879.1 winged helix-turn-helix domain-containing protein [Arenimonas sp.]
MANEQAPGWTFLSNHTHVLVCLAADGDLTLREVALRVGVTERAVQRIVADLELAGVLERTRDGRRNAYRIDPGVPLRHPLESHRRIGDLLGVVAIAPAQRTPTAGRSIRKAVQPTAAKPARKAAARPAAKRASKPTSKPTSKPPAKPPTKPTRTGRR